MARFIIWFLTLDWIVFGAMHFTGHEQTVQQMPDVVPPAWRWSISAVRSRFRRVS